MKILKMRAVQFSILEQQLPKNLKRFRGRLVFKAHRLVYHSALGSRVIKNKKLPRREQSILRSNVSGSSVGFTVSGSKSIVACISIYLSFYLSIFLSIYLSISIYRDASGVWPGVGGRNAAAAKSLFASVKQAI